MDTKPGLGIVDKREAIATEVKVAGTNTSANKAEELAGVVGVTVPAAGAVATESIISSPTRASGPVARAIRVSVLEEWWQWE
jgi:hypothetical protein